MGGLNGKCQPMASRPLTPPRCAVWVCAVTITDSQPGEGPRDLGLFPIDTKREEVQEGCEGREADKDGGRKGRERQGPCGERERVPVRGEARRRADKAPLAAQRKRGATLFWGFEDERWGGGGGAGRRGPAALLEHQALPHSGRC